MPYQIQQLAIFNGKAGTITKFTSMRNLSLNYDTQSIGSRHKTSGLAWYKINLLAENKDSDIEEFWTITMNGIKGAAQLSY